MEVDKMKKLIALVVVAMLALSAFAALAENGTLTLATNVNFPPYVIHAGWKKLFMIVPMNNAMIARRAVRRVSAPRAEPTRPPSQSIWQLRVKISPVL